MKSSRAEVEERVFMIAKEMLNGRTFSRDIFHYVSENTDWNLTERQISNYIREARNLIGNSRSDDLQFEKSLAIGQLNDLIRLNYEKGDLREVRNCIKDKASLLGLIESRFAGKLNRDKEPAKLVVRSRYADRWNAITKGAESKDRQ